MLALFLSLVLLLSSLPCTAFAVDDEAVAPEESLLQTEEDEDAAPAETANPDTPSAAPTEITNLDELLAAIEAAESGDTIVLQHQINISENCVIGDMEKRVTLVPTDNFDGEALFRTMEYEEQNISIQNLILDGLNTPNVSAILANPYTFKGMKGAFQLSNTEIKNFESDQSNVCIYALDATITACSFCDNTATRTAGIEIGPNATADISDCLFSGNISYGDGGALRCRGQVQISDSIIIGNQVAYNGTSFHSGGGICIDTKASCQITACQITDNTANLGGGLAVFGEAVIVDTLLCHNHGASGASDIRAFSGTQLTVTYSEEMNAVYTGDTPIGFYADDFENPFDAENNAVFLGESLTGEISNNQFGAKFIFAADLPAKEPKEPESSTESAPSTEAESPHESGIPSEPEPSDESEDDTPYRPAHSPTPPVVQEEETQRLKLSFGGATLDTGNPIALYGYGDGELHEADPITKAQIAVLLYRGLDEESRDAISGNASAFADVEAGVWYYDAVSALASAGIVQGYDGLFCPNNNLTFGQLITLLTRFVEPKTTTMPDDLPYREHWAYDSIVTAAAYGWIKNPASIEPDRSVARGEVVEFINSIFASCKG